MVEHIKINNCVPRVQYIANGEISSFEFSFAVFSKDDLKVYLNSELQTGTYNAYISESSQGGNIVFNVAPLQGCTVTILRDLAIERTTDFQEGGTLRADVLNDELDRQTAFIQQIADNLNRSMVLPPYATNSSVDLTLPYPEAGKAIIWNSEGNNLENSTIEINNLESTLNSYKEYAKEQAEIAEQKAEQIIEYADTVTTKAEEAASSAADAQSSAEEAASILSNKANIDGSNFSNTGKIAINTFGQPNYSAAVIMNSAWNTAVTANSNGLVWINDNDLLGEHPVYFTCAGQTFTVNYNATGVSISGGALFPVQKGQLYKGYGGNNTNRALIFIPYSGG